MDEVIRNVETAGAARWDSSTPHGHSPNTASVLTMNGNRKVPYLAEDDHGAEGVAADLVAALNEAADLVGRHERDRHLVVVVVVAEPDLNTGGKGGGGQQSEKRPRRATRMMSDNTNDQTEEEKKAPSAEQTTHHMNIVWAQQPRATRTAAKQRVGKTRPHKCTAKTHTE